MASLDYLAEHGYEGCDDILNNDALYDALGKLSKIKPRYAKYIKAYYLSSQLLQLRPKQKQWALQTICHNHHNM